MCNSIGINALGAEKNIGHSLSNSCSTLFTNGLDDTLYELLLIVHQASVLEVVTHLGITQFAAKARATDQLKRLYLTWVQEYYPDVSIGLLGDAEIHRRGKKILSLEYPEGKNQNKGGRYEGGEEQGNTDMCANMMAIIERNCLGNAIRSKKHNDTEENIGTEG